MRQLKAARALSGLRQVDVAQAVNRTQAWMSLIETGRLLPSRQKAIEIARALDQDPRNVFPWIGANHD